MIKEELIEYAEAHTSDELPLLARLSRETHLTQVYPRMLAGNLQGTLLRLISHMVKPKRILEIGTFTGYSAICLARGLAENGLLHTIDINDELTDMAFKYFGQAGLTEKIIMHTGDAREIIPGLRDNFDLVFIDGDKEQYLEYYQRIMKKLKTGGFIIADNVLWDGKVVHQSKKPDRETAGIIAFNNLVQGDDRVENVIISDRDGLMIIRKK